MKSLEARLADVVARFETKLDWIATENARRQRSEIPGFRDTEASELWEVGRRITRESRWVQAQYLLRGRDLPKTCPEPDAEAARFAARAAISISETLKAYLIGHLVTVRAWRDAIDELELPDDERTDVERAVADFAEQYYHRVTDLVAEEYDRERTRMRSRPETGRLQMVRDVLEHRRRSLGPSGYDLRLEHVSVIASGSQAAGAVRGLARASDSRIFDVAAEGLVLAWLGRDSWENRVATLAQFEPPANTAVAIGDPHPDLSGFRTSHQEAGDAHVVALRMPRAVTMYADVAIEAFGLRDETAARAFVASQLRGLTGEDRESQKLRRTLTEFFRHDQNRASTAAALGVHAATVPRQLREIEKRLGRRLDQHRAELEFALRLRSLFSSDEAADTAMRSRSTGEGSGAD